MWVTLSFLVGVKSVLPQYMQMIHCLNTKTSGKVSRVLFALKDLLIRIWFAVTCSRPTLMFSHGCRAHSLSLSCEGLNVSLDCQSASDRLQLFWRPIQHPNVRPLSVTAVSDRINIKTAAFLTICPDPCQHMRFVWLRVRVENNVSRGRASYFHSKR